MAFSVSGIIWQHRLIIMLLTTGPTLPPAMPSFAICDRHDAPSHRQILRTLERKVKINSEPKESKKVVSGQLDMYNYKLADLAHELDKIDLNELTPIEALNILVKMKEKIG